MRPDQWTKNLVLFAGLVFSGGLGDRGLVLLAVWGFVVFCGLSGSAYILNDLADLRSDREHPEKRARPIASGALRAGPAAASAAVVAFVALFFAYRANVAFGHVALAYVCLNALYSLVLRRVVILDVMSIAVGFVLRAVASVEVLVAHAPDPSDPRVGESFTLRLDGSDPTIDAARVQAGAASRFGVVQQPDPATYLNLPARPLRPSLAPGGARVAVEVLTRAWLADDGTAARTLQRVSPLDRLGNITDPAAATPVTLRTSGPVRIAFPDTDGDPHLEIVSVVDAIGAAIELDDSGGAFDDVDADALLIEAGDALVRVELLLPDPDVDDSGTVATADVDAINAHLGDRLGDAGFASRFDLNGSGRIDAADVAIAMAQLGALVTIP
jgi:hypothetical protein